MIPVKNLPHVSFNVPRSTLTRKIALHTTFRSKMSPDTRISETEDKILENRLLTIASKGFSVHKQNLIFLEYKK